MRECNRLDANPKSFLAVRTEFFCEATRLIDISAVASTPEGRSGINAGPWRVSAILKSHHPFRIGVFGVALQCIPRRRSISSSSLSDRLDMTLGKICNGAGRGSGGREGGNMTAALFAGRSRGCPHRSKAVPAFRLSVSHLHGRGSRRA